MLYQSRRLAAYDDALDGLTRSGRLFPCSCTRAILGPGGNCGRRCRPGPDDAQSFRLALTAPAPWPDFILGEQRPAPDAGDIVLRRRDGLHAYALAVVVDDAYQGITRVVRGSDLLEQTPAQLQLFELLGAMAPLYGHIPLACNERGKKLSKQSGAEAIDAERPLENLRAALRFLRQPSADADADSPEELLQEACRRWTRAALAASGGAHGRATTASP